MLAGLQANIVSICSLWPSHESSGNFIFTHVSVLGVCQISSSVPPVGRELLFKSTGRVESFRRCPSPAAPLGVDLGCRGHVT